MRHIQALSLIHEIFIWKNNFMRSICCSGLVLLYGIQCFIYDNFYEEDNGIGKLSNLSMVSTCSYASEMEAPQIQEPIISISMARHLGIDNYFTWMYPIKS